MGNCLGKHLVVRILFVGNRFLRVIAMILKRKQQGPEIRTIFTICAVLSIFIFAGIHCAKTSPTEDAGLQKLKFWMTGSFSSREQAEANSNYFDVCIVSRGRMMGILNVPFLLLQIPCVLPVHGREIAP